jgi:transcriptional regulator with XRE-family HTH domain
VSTAFGAPDDDEPVGAILARMRRTQGLTGAQLAAIVGMSQPKISRIERGQGLPDPQDVGVIARALGAGDRQARELMGLAERSHDRMTDWRPAVPSIAGRQRAVFDWESASTAIKAFEPTVVPGALQTSGYARVLLQAFQRIAPLAPAERTESALLAAVSARVKRQEVLADPARSIKFILGEAVLRSRVHPPAEMLAQIGHIREVAARSAHVEIAVVPDIAPVELPLLHNFMLFDDKFVMIDLYNTGLTSRSRNDVESYRKVFDAFAEHAVDISPLLDRYELQYIESLHRTRMGGS